MRLLIRHVLHLESLGVAGIELFLKGSSRAGLDHLSQRAHTKLNEEGYKINQTQTQIPVALPVQRENDFESLEASDIDKVSAEALAILDVPIPKANLLKECITANNASSIYGRACEAAAIDKKQKFLAGNLQKPALWKIFLGMFETARNKPLPLTPPLLREAMFQCQWNGTAVRIELKKNIEIVLQMLDKTENPALHEAKNSAQRELFEQAEKELGGSVQKSKKKGDLFPVLSRAFNMNGRDCSIFIASYHFITRTMDDRANFILQRCLGENKELNMNIEELQRQKETMLNRKKIIKRSSPRKLLMAEQIETLDHSHACTVENAQIAHLQESRQELLSLQESSAERTVLDPEDGDRM